MNQLPFPLLREASNSTKHKHIALSFPSPPIGKQAAADRCSAHISLGKQAINSNMSHATAMSSQIRKKYMCKP